MPTERRGPHDDPERRAKERDEWERPGPEQAGEEPEQLPSPRQGGLREDEGSQKKLGSQEAVEPRRERRRHAPRHREQRKGAEGQQGTHEEDEGGAGVQERVD